MCGKNRSKVQLNLCMWVCWFEWSTLCEGVTSSAVVQASPMLFGFVLSPKGQNRRTFLILCSLMVSQQYSVTSKFCRFMKEIFFKARFC